MNDEEDKKIREYERYNLLHWLAKSAPGSIMAQNAFKEAQEKNPNYKPREYPDLDSWVGMTRGVEETSYITAEEMLKISPENLIEDLINYKGHDRYEGRTRDAFLGEVGKAISINSDWGFVLITLLVKKKEFKEDIWHSIFIGLEKGQLTEGQWNNILDIISNTGELHSEQIGVADLFEKTIKKDNGFPENVLSMAETVSDDLWNSYIKTQPDVNLQYGGWLTEAINNSAGKISEFWIQALYKRYNSDKEDWKGIPSDYKKRISLVLNGKDDSSGFGRCVLASRLHYFLSIDWEWSKETFLPLFNYDNYPKNHEIADQAWHGLLMWGKLPVELFEDFKPLFKSAVENFEDTDERLRERLFEFIVSQLLVKSGNPLEDSWFYDEIVSNEKTSDIDRGYIADIIWHRLLDENDEYKISIWNRWLKQYMNMRISGENKLLNNEELKSFIEWVPYLEPVFEDVIKVIKNVDLKKYDLEFLHVYRELNKKGYANSNPESLLSFLTFLLDDGKVQLLHEPDLIPLYESLEKDLGKDRLKGLLSLYKQKGMFLNK